MPDFLPVALPERCCRVLVLLYSTNSLVRKGCWNLATLYCLSAFALPPTGLVVQPLIDELRIRASRAIAEFEMQARHLLPVGPADRCS